MTLTDKKNLFVLFLSLIASAAVWARSYGADVVLSSPYHTIYNHLYFLQDNSYTPERAALSLYQDSSITDEKLKKQAMSLKRIFDASGYYIELDEVPRNPDFYDSTLQKYRYYPIAGDRDVYLEKYGDKWLYAKKTVSLIDEKHSRLFPPGTEWLVHLLQMKGHYKIMGFYLWQITGLLLLTVLAVFLHHILKFFFNKILKRIFESAALGAVPALLYERIAGSLSLFAVALMVNGLIPVFQLPVLVSKYLLIFFKVLYPFFGMLAAYRMVDLLAKIMENMAAKTVNTLDDQLVPLIRKSLRVFVVGVGVVFTLQNLNFNITALLAGISIGGLAFALAAQDTLKNFFGSLMIFMDKPFQVGDWITCGDIDGEVEEVGFRSTRIRTFRHSLVYVSNGKLADAVIDNHGARQYRRFYTRLSITYDTPPQAIQAFVDGLNRLVQEYPHARKDKQHIVLNEFGASGLEIMFYIFFKAPNWGAELDNRHAIMLKIIELARELGVRFAFPTHTLHIESMPEK